MNKKALINVSVDGILYKQGKVYSAAEVEHIDQTNFQDTEEEVSLKAEGAEAPTNEETTTTTDENQGGEKNTDKGGVDITDRSVYKITNKASGETLEVILHTAGEGYDLFAAADTTEEAWTSPDLVTYRFENPNKDGNLTSEEWDIALVEPVA